MKNLLILYVLISILIASACTNKLDIEEKNKNLIRRMIERVDAEGASAYNEFVASDAIWHSPKGFAEAKAAFTNEKHTIEDVVAEGDKVVARFTLRATHTGEYMSISPTGKEVTFTVLAIYRIMDSKIVEGWFLFDALVLLEQIKADASTY